MSLVSECLGHPCFQKDFILSSSNPSVPAAASNERSAAIARQPIVDERRSIFGYHFSERPRAASNEDAQIFDAISEAGSETLAGRKTVFLPCTFESIAEGHLEVLNPEAVVLELPTPVPAAAENCDAQRQLLERARELGLRLAFDHSALQDPAYDSWLPLASFIKLDMHRLAANEIDAMVKSARSRSKATVLADNVNSAEQFEKLKLLGVRLFQGNWFEQPAEIKDKAVQASHASIIRLINLVRNEADVDEIEDVLKKDPVLSLKLLRFINSVGFGLSVEITSFRHAVMILGLNKLFRWATLLMTTARPGGAAPAAGTAAVVRGRLMELLAAELIPKEECDNAFVVGVFSMLDTLLGMPLPKALESISLPQPVIDALLRNEGTFAPFLTLTKACESGDEAAFAKAAEELQLSNHQINWAHLQALMWADEISE